ncbi:hypothetical protein KNP414_03567 [Paenibacillus mucilaginosus KNP414]|uniref:Uncharacterized protein n=1 Tax=Paenibacillus mucilaginosus (strain KNP414) TaxID=1036673 RepID=F8FDE1_PAEMK|nr:hypothetical protein KNP414_03567 [Paenibacillus mucilaginosus KNP414]
MAKGICSFVVYFLIHWIHRRKQTKTKGDHAICGKSSNTN